MGTDLDDLDDPAGWEFAPETTIAPGLRAWTALGGGGRCECWLAWSDRHWCPVVVKLPRPGRMTEPATLAGLTREARIAGALAHPAIQRLLDARLDDDIPHLIFEYVEGPSLSTSLAEDGPLDTSDAVRLGIQLAAALHYLHGAGFLHLDLKPSNLCLREGRPVILDFETARRVGEPRPPGAPIGSLPYMAPEQLRDEPGAPRSDLFALGAVLYEAVTGTRPHDGARSCEGRLDPPLADLIARLLAAEPARRPADAFTALTEMARALPAGEEDVWPEWVL
jgi:serine/threonine protein kinase